MGYWNSSLILKPSPSDKKRRLKVGQIGMWRMINHIDDLAQDCGTSFANALVLA